MVLEIPKPTKSRTKVSMACPYYFAGSFGLAYHAVIPLVSPLNLTCKGDCLPHRSDCPTKRLLWWH